MSPPHESPVTIRLKPEAIATSWHPHGTSPQLRPPTAHRRNNDTSRPTTLHPSTSRYVILLSSNSRHSQWGQISSREKKVSKVKESSNEYLGLVATQLKNQQPNDNSKPQSWVKSTDPSLVPVKSSLRPRRYAPPALSTAIFLPPLRGGVSQGRRITQHRDPADSHNRSSPKRSPSSPRAAPRRESCTSYFPFSPADRQAPLTTNPSPTTNQEEDGGANTSAIGTLADSSTSP